MALLVVLGIIVLFSMLGFMGLSMAAKDSGISGAILDIRSKESAAQGGLNLALGRLVLNGDSTAAILNRFIADSSSSTPRQWIDFATSPFSLQTNDPGYYSIAAGEQSAVKVRVVSMDIGTSAGKPDDGVKITLECTGRGRNGDELTVEGTYRFVGLDVATKAAGSAITSNYAVYINGALSNSSISSSVTGNVYIGGDVTTNSAALTVSGTLRVNGSLTTNSALVDSGNAVVAGDLNTNGSAPMTFLKNLVVKGGVNTMNSALKVAGNLEIQSNPATAGTWGSGASLTVGGQFWDRKECRDIQAKVTVGGNAFFDSCAILSSSGTSTFSNLYLGRSGNPAGNKFSNGTVNISGALGAFNSSSSNAFLATGSTVTATGRAIFREPLQQINSGAVVVGGDAQFWQGIGAIGNGTSSGAIRIGGTTFLYSPDQQGFNGKVSLGSDLTMTGAVNSNFGQNGSQQWFFLSGATGRKWLYENGAALGTPDPRVQNASTTNATAFKGASGTLTRPSLLFTAPTPVEATAYATDAYTTDDLDLSTTESWNQAPSVDSNVLAANWTVLTDAMCTAAGANTNNWTASDFSKIYSKYKNSSGWLIMKIGSGCSLSGLSSPGGTWSGKAIWAIDKTISVNGNWPASATSSDLQMIYVFGSGHLSQFGSPGNFYGYVYFANTYTGTMSWGNGSSTVTLTGALHLTGASTNLTGNGGSTLNIVGSQAVLDKIQAAVPGLLVSSTPSNSSSSSSSSGSSSAVSLRTLVCRYTTGISLVPVGEFR